MFWISIRIFLIQQGSVSPNINVRINLNYSYKQDGPSLESSSYLNLSLRYLGPWDPETLGPLDLGTLGSWDSLTSSLCQHLLILPLRSSYLLLSLPPTLLLWYCLVCFVYHKVHFWTGLSPISQVWGGVGRREEVKESQGPRVPRSRCPKDQDISNSHSNTSLTLKKGHLVSTLKWNGELVT